MGFGLETWHCVICHVRGPGGAEHFDQHCAKVAHVRKEHDLLLDAAREATKRLRAFEKLRVLPPEKTE